MNEHTANDDWAIMCDGPNGDSKPWLAKDEAAPGLTIGSLDHTEPICRVSGYLRDAEDNAALIVRAVNAHDDLLAACKAMLEWCDVNRYAPLCIDKVRTAIDKATSH